MNYLKLVVCATSDRWQASLNILNILQRPYEFIPGLQGVSAHGLRTMGLNCEQRHIVTYAEEIYQTGECVRMRVSAGTLCVSIFGGRVDCGNNSYRSVSWCSQSQLSILSSTSKFFLLLQAGTFSRCLVSFSNSRSLLKEKNIKERH